MQKRGAKVWLQTWLDHLKEVTAIRSKASQQAKVMSQLPIPITLLACFPEPPKNAKRPQKVEVVFPNQENRGTHVNLSGVGVVKAAPNKANAIKFIEFLASDRAQEVFAKGNNEYPVAPSAQTIPVLKEFGKFKEDKVNAAKFGNNNTEAIRMMDRAGWR